MATPTVKVSDIVLYALAEVERPAIVVDVPNAENGVVSLVVFLDGRHDDGASPPVTVRWQPAVAYGESGEPGTWHQAVGEVTAPTAPAPSPAAPADPQQAQLDEIAALRAENARLKADAVQLTKDVTQ